MVGTLITEAIARDLPRNATVSTAGGDVLYIIGSRRLSPTGKPGLNRVRYLAAPSRAHYSKEVRATALVGGTLID